MTILYSRGDKSRDLTGESPFAIVSSWRTPANWLRALTRGAIGRIGAALTLVHRGIVTAKTRRLQRELMFHAGAHHDGGWQQDADIGRDAAKFPQPPLILGDKWDF